jgi:hypothetical protein
MAAHEQESSNKRRLVIGLDYGTTYTGMKLLLPDIIGR